MFYSFPYGAVGRSAVCDCVIAWAYSLTVLSIFFYYYLTVEMLRITLWYMYFFREIEAMASFIRYASYIMTPHTINSAASSFNC